MGEPKTPFSLLSNFPPDVWALISPYLPGESLPVLKLSGTRVIWRNLTAVNVVKSVVLGEELVTFKRWPAFLKELPSVVELVLQRYTEKWLLDMGLKLNMLPSQLRILRTKSPTFATKHLFTKDDGTTMMTLKEHLPHLEILDVPEISWQVPHFPWVVEAPENLTTLVCSEWETNVSLPASLTCLSAHYIRYRDSCIFPPNLQILRFNYTKDDPSDCVLAGLPSSITELESVWCRVPLALVPKNVTKLHINFSPNLPTSSHFTVPHSLKHLTVNEIPPDSWHHLSKLEYLKVHHLPSKHWSCLPSGLSTLDIREISSEEAIEDQSVTDPTDGNCYVSPGLPIHKLPKSLTKCTLGHISPVLDLFSMGEARQIFFVNWTRPSSVESEHMTPSLSQKSLSELFPPYLTNLTLWACQLSMESTMQLPSTLSTLIVLNLDSASVKYLPRRLTSLEGRIIGISKELLEHLPQSLTSLYLQLCTPDNYWINVRTGQEVQVGELLEGQEELGLADSLISLLPPYLSKLHIRYGKKLSGKCFKSLPRYLIELDISTLEVDDTDLQFLPSSLQRFSLPDDTNLTKACLVHLPAGIEVFQIPMNENFQEKEQFIDSLPRLLLSKRSYNSFVTKHWIFSYGGASPRRFSSR